MDRILWTSDGWAILQTIVATLGLVLALVQTLRYRSAKSELDKVNRMKIADIWANISMTLEAYETLEDARRINSRSENDPTLSAKLNSARRSVVAQYIQLLRQAAMAEPEFTEETVKEWQRVGRLENQWRVTQALRFVRTNLSPRDREPSS